MGEDREDAEESPLDLGLRDLLALHEVWVPASGGEPSPSESVPRQIREEPPPQPELSPYATIAATSDWGALVRRCEQEGLKTGLSRVWWMRAHLERGSMPTALLVSARDRAESEGEQPLEGETEAEASERVEVLAACCRWFPKEPSAPPSEVNLAPTSAEKPPPDREKDGMQVATVLREVNGGRTSIRTDLTVGRMKRAGALAALLFLLVGLFFAGKPRDELLDLTEHQFLESPVPEVPLKLRLSEPSPLTGLDVLQVAMEELVKTKEDEENTIPQPVEQPPVSQPAPSLVPQSPPTPSAPKEKLAVNGPFEPMAIRELRLHPQRDPGPTGKGRGGRESLSSVWDQIGGMTTPAPRGAGASDPRDFFDGVDDHPGYPVERLQQPQQCWLAVGGSVRTRPSDFAPSTSRLDEGDTVMIEERMGPWLKLKGRSGRPGYLKSFCRGEAENAGRGDDDEAEWKR